MCGAIPPVPNTPSWCGAWLSIETILTFNLYFIFTTNVEMIALYPAALFCILFHLNDEIFCVQHYYSASYPPCLLSGEEEGPEFWNWLLRPSDTVI
jgi:hypothetical protein